MRSFLAIVQLVIKRSANNIRLLVSTFLGLIITVSLISAVPLYTHGTLERLLQQRLHTDQKRPAGTVWIRHLQDRGNPDVTRAWPEFDKYFMEGVSWILDLPVNRIVRYIAGDVYVLWPAAVEGQIPQSERRYGYVAYHQDLAKYSRIVEGVGLPTTPAAEGEDIPAIISIATSEELHMAVGDRFIYSDVERFNPSGITLKVVGIWDALEPDSDFWIYDPYLYNNTLFISEENIMNNVFVRLPRSAHEFSWYAIADSSQIHSVNASRVLAGLHYLETRASVMIPGARLFPTLPDTLAEFERRAFVLNILLFTLSVPMVAVVLYYIATSIGMVIERQRGEIALMKSRGTSTIQLMGIYFLEGVLMGGLALLIGPFVGEAISQLIGQAYGFLAFARRPPLFLTINAETMRYAGAAVALAIGASLIPAVSAARHSIVSYKQEVARSNRRPLYQRFFIDVALLAIAAYGYRMLQQKQSILTLAKDETLLIDPLLLIVPSLFIFALSLMFLRIFPLLTRGFSRLAALVGGASVLLALRQIARTPVQYASLVLLLVLTLALGSYAASAAHTIDTNFTHRVFYDIPADLELWEAWDYDEEGGFYYVPPFSAHFVQGVVEASPFKLYKVQPRLSRRTPDAQLLAIERTTYPTLGWWRADFSDKPLGALMNALGANEAALIVSPEFMQQNQLSLGDPVTLVFENTPVEFYIAESVKNFPMLYPEKGFFFIANLDYIYDMIGQQPYRVWLQVDPNERSADIVDRLRENGIRAISIRDSRVAVNYGRTDPQRTGMFGVLSIGFVVAALLTVLGFFLYAFLSFEKRLVQLGILRAMGLSVRQLLLLLVFEQVYLILLGVAFGTGLGVWTGSLFIPFLQVGAEAGGQMTPKFVVETAWTDIQRIYIVLGVMLFLGLLSTIWLIGRMQLYRTVKMGEEQ
ncbi:MAG: ABC transporter permease [Chloroflexi bacterium]|nr:ABC transporter permease [Chloroflexota bacterium]